jgi:hypothetical protein
MQLVNRFPFLVAAAVMLTANPAAAVTIVSGSATTSTDPPRPYTHGSNLGSANGGLTIYSLDITAVFDGTIGYDREIPAGIASITAGMDPDYQSHATVAVDGRRYGLILSGPFGRAQSDFNFSTYTFIVDHSGFYTVPFTLWGRLEGSTDYETLILNERIQGIGVAHFALRQDYWDPSVYNFASDIEWEFVPSPEPGSAVLLMSGLALERLLSLFRRRRAGGF